MLKINNSCFYPSLPILNFTLLLKRPLSHPRSIQTSRSTDIKHSNFNSCSPSLPIAQGHNDRRTMEQAAQGRPCIAMTTAQQNKNPETRTSLSYINIYSFVFTKQLKNSLVEFRLRRGLARGLRAPWLKRDRGVVGGNKLS